MDWQALRKFLIGEKSIEGVRQGKTFRATIAGFPPYVGIGWLLEYKSGNVAPRPLLRVFFVKVPKKEKGGT